MNNKQSTIFLCSILLINSTVSVADSLVGPDLIGYSAIAVAAITIEADGFVSDDLGSQAAVNLGAGAETANLYAGAAVTTGAGSSAGNIYAGEAAGIGADGTAGNIYAGAAVVIGAAGSAANLYSGTAISLGDGASVGDIYATGIITGTGANSTTAYTNTASSIDAYKETLDTAKAIEQITSAQVILFGLYSDFSLPTTLGTYTFEPGVYEGSALTITAESTITLDGKGEENPLWIFNFSGALSVGASTMFEITNAGAGASVIWNTGGAVTLGAQTSFIGTAFANGAISGGAGSNVSCGNLFSLAAIDISSLISTNCIGTDTWAGSINGLNDSLSITDGVASNGISVPFKTCPKNW
ncbi:hypothetical protein CXF72_08770 [Psychromonas sp. MB-3u-54]|uniref:ice-binding family protein n=1 Tax=Psychromonas sp. MB-3u-54 TaxID=2058319 RepID=UPI000C322EC1|nr:ice-binding family protein [Psychromonas sp. MB-3u-54]PKH03008.1 hypothetical protein CXF72_08770 [Psychromonas sp. MB-3u-54]